MIVRILLAIRHFTRILIRIFTKILSESTHDFHQIFFRISSALMPNSHRNFTRIVQGFSSESFQHFHHSLYRIFIWLGLSAITKSLKRKVSSGLSLAVFYLYFHCIRCRKKVLPKVLAMCCQTCDHSFIKKHICSLAYYKIIVKIITIINT